MKGQMGFGSTRRHPVGVAMAVSLAFAAVFVMQAKDVSAADVAKRAGSVSAEPKVGPSVPPPAGASVQPAAFGSGSTAVDRARQAQSSSSLRSAGEPPARQAWERPQQVPLGLCSGD